MQQSFEFKWIATQLLNCPVNVRLGDRNETVANEIIELLKLSYWQLLESPLDAHKILMRI